MSLSKFPKKLTPSWILRLLCGSFLVGTFCASFGFPFPFGEPNVIWLVAGMSMTAVGSFWFANKTKKRDLVAVLTITSIGFFGAWVHYGWQAQVDVSRLQEREQVIVGTIINNERSTDVQKITVQTGEDRLLVFAPLYPSLHYGDVLSFSCDVRRAEAFNGFAYDRYLATQEIYHTCFLYESPIVLEEGQGNQLLGWLNGLHDTINVRIEALYGEPHAALLSGLLLGDQRFSDRWEERFQMTGTTHIVAASGYNVTVVLFILFGLLVYLRVRRQHAYALLLLGVAAYVVLAGADAPIVRAGIMGALVLTGRQLGRRSNMTNVLLLAAVAMLVVEPRLLRDDVGFQLSALSTVGLVYGAPIVEKWFRFVPKTLALRESLAATVTATLATLPIVLLQFGQFSLVSPVANLLILPVLPFAMAFGVISLLVSLASVPFAIVTTGPAWALLSYVFWVIDALADLPLTTVHL